MKFYHFFLFSCLCLFTFSCDTEKIGCIDHDLINLDTPVSLDYNPVCGCNGITYPNTEAARLHGGNTNWTDGPCFEDVTTNCDSTTIFKAWNDPNCGLLLTALDVQKFEVNDMYGNISLLNNQQIAAYYKTSTQLGSCGDLSTIDITGFCNYSKCTPYDIHIYSGTNESVPYWGDAIRINTVWKEGSCLFLNVTYSGGCEKHIFRLIKSALVHESIMLFPNFLFDHQSFNDPCETSITETISFDISYAQSGLIESIINSSDRSNYFNIQQ